MNAPPSRRTSVADVRSAKACGASRDGGCKRTSLTTFCVGSYRIHACGKNHQRVPAAHVLWRGIGSLFATSTSMLWTTAPLSLIVSKTRADSDGRVRHRDSTEMHGPGAARSHRRSNCSGASLSPSDLGASSIGLVASDSDRSRVSARARSSAEWRGCACPHASLVKSALTASARRVCMNTGSMMSDALALVDNDPRCECWIPAQLTALRRR